MSETPAPELTERPETVLAVRRATLRIDGLRDFFDSAYGEVARVVGAQGAQISGPAVAVYHQFDPAGDVVVAAGFPTATPVEAQDGVEPLRLDAGRVARLEHVGSYDGLGDAHGRLHAWMAEQSLRPGVPFTETYVTEPTPDADPGSMRTVVEYPVA